MEITLLKNQLNGNVPVTFPVFEANQILSSMHLNDLREYLDRQNRLTRNRLFGQGIISGLEIINKTSLRNYDNIKVSEGLGLTSEGFMIETTKKEFTHIRKYTDPARYEPFFPDNNEQVTLWELAEEKNIMQDEITSYSLVKDNSGLLTDKSLIIYLELLEEYQKSCFTFSCDGKGSKMIFNIRYLLVGNNVLNQWLKKQYNITTSEGLIDYVKGIYRLPSINIKKLQLFSNNKPVSFKTYNELAIAYNGLIKGFADELEDGITNINKILDLCFGNIGIIPPIKSEMMKIATNNISNIQYVFDLCCDLINIYNQVCHTMHSLVDKHSFVKEEFPRHLIIGTFNEEDSCNRSVYRSYLKQPLTCNNGTDKYQLLIFLLNKIRLMVSEFSVTNQRSSSIIVTPDNGCNEDPGTIPFYYYPVNDNSGLYKFWNYKLSKECCPERVLSYWAGKYTTDTKVINPLNYYTNNHNFLRIEGHIGQTLEVAEKTIEEIKIKYNLPFKVISLSLSQKIDAADYGADFNFDFFTRKKNINKKTLENFLNQYTGLEHTGGVLKGGTFILVYEETVNEKEIVSKVVADFALPYIVDLVEEKTLGDFNNDFNEDLNTYE